MKLLHYAPFRIKKKMDQFQLHMITFYKCKFFQHTFRQVRPPTLTKRMTKEQLLLNIPEAKANARFRFFEALQKLLVFYISKRTDEIFQGNYLFSNNRHSRGNIYIPSTVTTATTAAARLPENTGCFANTSFPKQHNLLQNKRIFSAQDFR